MKKMAVFSLIFMIMIPLWGSDFSGRDHAALLDQFMAASEPDDLILLSEFNASPYEGFIDLITSDLPRYEEIIRKMMNWPFLDLPKKLAEELLKTQKGFLILESMSSETLDKLFPRLADLERGDRISCLSLPQLLDRMGINAIHEEGYLGENINIFVHDSFSNDSAQLGHGDIVAYIIDRFAPKANLIFVDNHKPIILDKNKINIINMSYGIDSYLDVKKGFHGYLTELENYVRQGAIIVKSAGNNNLFMGSTQTSRRLVAFVESINLDPDIDGCILLVGSADVPIPSLYSPGKPSALLSSYSDAAGLGFRSYVYVSFSQLLLPSKYDPELHQFTHFSGFEHAIGTSLAAAAVSGALALALNILSREENGIKKYKGKTILTRIINSSQTPSSASLPVLENITKLSDRSWARLVSIDPKYVFGLGEFNLAGLIMAPEDMIYSHDLFFSYDEEIGNMIRELRPSHLHPILDNSGSHLDVDSVVDAVFNDIQITGYDALYYPVFLSRKLEAFGDSLVPQDKLSLCVINYFFISLSNIFTDRKHMRELYKNNIIYLMTDCIYEITSDNSPFDEKLSEKLAARVLMGKHVIFMALSANVLRNDVQNSKEAVPKVARIFDNLMVNATHNIRTDSLEKAIKYFEMGQNEKGSAQYNFSAELEKFMENYSEQAEKMNESFENIINSDQA